MINGANGKSPNGKRADTCRSGLLVTTCSIQEFPERECR